VQSLLAVGTRDTQFGPGQIYIFGQARVCAVLSLPKKASVKILQFCADKILCLDSRNDLTVFSLETKRLVTAYSPSGVVSALHSDPTLDWAFLGTQTGEVLIYDLDRQRSAPLRLPNFWKDKNPRSRAPIVSLALHPRDVGKLLIGYTEGAVVYTFKQNQPQKYFQYVVPRGAPGGDSDPASMGVNRSPRLTQALWHPTGTFILTGHEDSSLVFWDPKDGRILMARTLHDTRIDQPGASAGYGADAGAVTVKEPLYRIAWCANKDPDDTAILIAGGASVTQPTKGLTFFELGRTPVYNTSSWQVLSDHFENPKRQRILPTPPNTEVTDFCVLPRDSPHFAGACDPIAAIALLSSGEIITLSIPSGFPISPTNQLHLSMTLIHPFPTAVSMAAADRTRWLGLVEQRAKGPPLLKGGAESPRPVRRSEIRNIVQTAHADGTIRLWDAGHGDEIENEALIQTDVARALGRHDDVEVSCLSFSSSAVELAAGLRSGEVIVFRWSKNPTPGQEPPPPGPNEPGALTDITERRDPAVSEGLLPLTLLSEASGPVTAIKQSDIGFVAAGFEHGSLAVIDLRGPAVIFRAKVQDFALPEKRSSFRRGSQQNTPRAEWPTCIEFSIMTLEDEDYSSVLLHVGTNMGHLATFKIVPDPSGRFTVQLAGVIKLSDWVVHIAPMRIETGAPAYASQTAMSGLQDGFKVNGVLLTVTHSEVRIFKPASSKGAHKEWDDFLCDSAAVARYGDMGWVLLALCGDGCVRTYSIPALKEIGAIRVSEILDVKSFGKAMITQTGQIFGWKGPAEMAMVTVFGTGIDLSRPRDTLYNPQLLIPPRPTISNMQWISGTQFVTAADLDLLIGGPDRPPSKRMVDQSRADNIQRQREAGATDQAGASSPGGQQEGYWAYMQRQINERTEALGLANDNMDRLESTSSGWADDVSKFVRDQKRGMVKGGK
jgi:syntaxin-binding protein 5